jgi:VWFA-related protein
MRPKRIRKSLLILMLGLTPLWAQDIQIRTRVDLVQVPVTVKTSGDQLVSGLTKDDFQIFEDGKPQTITNFTIDPVPISAAVLLDTGLVSKSLIKVQKTLPALTGAFSAFDEIAVYRFDYNVTQLIDFTRDRAAVEKTLDKLKDIEPQNPRVPSGPFVTPGPMINGKTVAPSIDANTRVEPKYIKVLHDAIFMAATDLGKRPSDRRRIVLVVSDGRASGNEHSYDQAQTRLLENNIQVYSIGMDVAFLARRFSVLDDYSRATGGAAYFLAATDALERAYTRSVEEARNQYVLGYFSTNKAPGPLPIYRQIAVKTRRPGLDVRHRQGYYQYP